MPIEFLPTLTIDHHEEAQTHTFSVTESGITASVQLRVAWADRYSVMDDILFNAGTYPYLTSVSLGAKSATCVPDGAKALADGSGLTYGDALITINYDSNKKETEDEDIVSESMEPNLEFFNLPHADFRWGSAGGDALVAEESPGKLIVGFDYIQTRYNMATIDAAYGTELGKVNSGTITAPLSGLTFPAETLLYGSFSPNRKITTDGDDKWTAAAKFSFRPTGWNKFWRAKDQAWTSIYIAGGAEYKNFPTGTLPII